MKSTRREEKLTRCSVRECKILKTISTLVLVLAAGSSAFAGISIGINGNIGSGIGSVRTGEYEETYGGTDSNLNMTGGFSLAAQFAFGSGANSFIIRPEAGMLFNNGVGNGFHFTYEDQTLGTANDSDCSISVTTVELPVLFGMETTLNGCKLDYYIGPYLSIPVAGTVTTDSGTSQLKRGVPVFGATAGITGNLKAGPGAFVFDMRYLFDFAATKMEVADTDDTVSLYARRNIIVSAGYKLNF